MIEKRRAPEKRKAPEKLRVVDLRDVPTVSGLEERHKDYFYHGGGMEYRGRIAFMELLPDHPDTPARKPRPWEKQMLEEMQPWIKENLAPLKKEGSEYYSHSQKLEFRKEIERRLDAGEFNSEKGTITREDIFKGAIQSFLDGPLCKGLAFDKNDMHHDAKAKAAYEELVGFAEKKPALARMFGKPLHQVTRAEVLEKEKSGELTGYDALFAKGVTGDNVLNLRPEDIDQAERDGLITQEGGSGIQSREFWEEVMDKYQYAIWRVDVSPGISSFSKKEILVEAKAPDHFGVRKVPGYMLKIPKESINNLYLNAKGLSEEELADKVNTFHAAKELAGQYGETLKKISIPTDKSTADRAGHNEIKALAEEAGHDPLLLALAHKIAVNHPSFDPENYKGKIPAEEF